MSSGGLFKEGTLPVTSTHSNTDQTLIVVTEDKVRLAINEYLSAIENRKSWHTPCGLFVTILAMFTTADFKKFVFEPHEWKAIFVVCLFASAGWFFSAVYKSIKAPSPELLIEKIKNSQSKR